MVKVNGKCFSSTDQFDRWSVYVWDVGGPVWCLNGESCKPPFLGRQQGKLSGFPQRYWNLQNIGICSFLNKVMPETFSRKRKLEFVLTLNKICQNLNFFIFKMSDDPKLLVSNMWLFTLENMKFLLWKNKPWKCLKCYIDYILGTLIDI